MCSYHAYGTWTVVMSTTNLNPLSLHVLRFENERCVNHKGLELTKIPVFKLIRGSDSVIYTNS